jgi:ABC-type polysaccharide/polyol phosphate export permease
LNGFRLGIYYGILPSLQSIGLTMACGFISLIVGFAIFRRYQNSFVYYV